MSGKVAHFEIPADDMERAKKFYTDAFGWKMDPVPNMEYTLVRTTEVDEKGVPKELAAINGGMMKRQAPIEHPVITIIVEDMDASLKTIKKLGGKVAQKKMPVPGMGFSAYFVDSEGNLMGLFEPTMEMQRRAAGASP
jgi:predicted enzyme related to lactoylglutathione lyase